MLGYWHLQTGKSSPHYKRYYTPFNAKKCGYWCHIASEPNISYDYSYNFVVYKFDDEEKYSISLDEGAWQDVSFDISKELLVEFCEYLLKYLQNHDKCQYPKYTFPDTTNC